MDHGWQHQRRSGVAKQLPIMYLEVIMTSIQGRIIQSFRVVQATFHDYSVFEFAKQIGFSWQMFLALQFRIFNIEQSRKHGLCACQ